MCVVSNIGDHYRDTWKPYVRPAPPLSPVPFVVTPPVSREEFEALKRDVKECLRLLRAGKEIDAALGNPDCELDEKLAVIRRVAELVGVDLDEVLG